MTFSVIVPFLNEERSIEACARALINQNFDKREYEVIFVDNGSTDSSAEIVRRFPEISLLREEKKSAYCARNTGLEKARGGIIAFTDADCIVANGWLAAIHRGIERYRADMVLGYCAFSDGRPRALSFFEDYENTKAEYVVRNAPKKYLFGYTRNMAVRSELFRRFGPFSTSYLIIGDTEFIQRCVSASPDISVAYLEEMRVDHTEIRSALSWLDKLYSYGTNVKQGSEFHASNLTPAMRFEIASDCIRRRKYTFAQKIFFYVLLLAGNLFFSTGKIAGYMKR